MHVTERPCDVGANVPPHIHHLEDAISIVLEGEMGLRSEDREADAIASGPADPDTMERYGLALPD